MFLKDAAQKMNAIKAFFCKCDQIRSLLRMWSHLLKKSLKHNFYLLCNEVQENSAPQLSFKVFYRTTIKQALITDSLCWKWIIYYTNNLLLIFSYFDIWFSTVHVGNPLIFKLPSTFLQIICVIPCFQNSTIICAKTP